MYNVLKISLNIIQNLLEQNAVNPKNNQLTITMRNEDLLKDTYLITKVNKTNGVTQPILKFHKHFHLLNEIYLFYNTFYNFLN